MVKDEAASGLSPQEIQKEFALRGLPDDFCLVPFSTLILEPDGQVGSCRHKGSDFSVGSIMERSLLEIWNGPGLRSWRREFLKGEVQTCKTETRHRACHLCPRYNTLFPLVSPAEWQSAPPLRLGLNLNGHCNLRCRMCHVWKKPNGLYSEPRYWSQLEALLPHVREVELLSGEPFVQKDTYRLIDLISRINPACQWTITTNGHWKFNQRIEAALDKIPVKNLIVSLDSLNPQTYALIRGGSLEVVLKNLELLVQYDRRRIQKSLSSLGLKINFLVQKDNWAELAGFHEFGKAQKLEVFRTFLYEPLEFSLLSLSQSEREGILETYLASLSGELLGHSMRILVPLIDSLPKLAQCEYWLKLRNVAEHKKSIQALAFLAPSV